MILVPIVKKACILQVTIKTDDQAKVITIIEKKIRAVWDMGVSRSCISYEGYYQPCKYLGTSYNTCKDWMLLILFLFQIVYALFQV